ncbi:serine/threonine-protein kinase ULK3-like isoform X2 [Neocloeon triangulifer]|uniref:serine/threonine-protein kinase ULK3-like isoform X2 n=1 Tax=Neocloeon triangulifer TaxID=2078957 RepID=UPI00286EFF88|nr:serine/threonine-protein kinase ULK3-like isoform X2 [Neocloeon triangulifer]
MALPQIEGYVVVEKIGAGSYATVYKAYKKSGPRAVVAIKCVEKGKLSSTTIENLLTEISLLKKLKHPNIVEMKDFFWDDKYIHIVMDYCAGGDLSNLIRQKRRLPEKTCRRFLQQLASALQYIRSQNVSHMDLKPQNLLLASRTSPVLKMADFGFAQTLKSSDHSSSLRGSPLYMAPEILLSKSYDAKVDLWSVGVILYECLFGKAPYSSASLDQLLEKIKAHAPIEMPSSGYQVSAICQDLLTRLLQHDPAVRIDFPDFFAHPFLDLQHAPDEKSLEKATKLATEAVQADQEQNHLRAIQLYEQALLFLKPLYDAETDESKKSALQVTMNQYRRRMCELKTLTCGSSVSTAALRSSDSNFEELVRLSISTPSLHNALELGVVAEQYECERSYSVALEKYQSCLAILIEHLPREVKGSRRQHLLHLQVKKWLKRAEVAKAMMELPEDEEFSLDSKDNCWMQ